MTTEHLTIKQEQDVREAVRHGWEIEPFRVRGLLVLLDTARARLDWLERQAAKTVLIAGDPSHGFYVGAADGGATRDTLAEAIDAARGAQ